MGDCIRQARSFMRDCEDILATLDIDCATSRHKALSVIQIGAKQNHARAIYRAAQDAIASPQTNDSLTSRLQALEILIRNYDKGLAEMEHIANDGAAIDTITLSPSDAFQRARDTFSGVIALAKPEESAPLNTLLNLLGSNQAENTPSELGDISQNTVKLSLEAIIPDVVQQGLAAARQAGLTLSVSYDMGDVALPAPKTQIMKNRMKDWVHTLVLHMKATANTESLARIDMSARNEAVVITAECPPLSEDLLNSAPDGSRVLQTYHESKGVLELTLYYRHKKDVILAHKTLKKLPVEEGIASRLNALLEGAEDKTISLIDQPAFIESFSEAQTSDNDLNINIHTLNQKRQNAS